MSRLRRGWRWESAPTQAEVAQQQVNLATVSLSARSYRFRKPGEAPPTRRNVDVRAREVPGVSRRSEIDRQVARGECKKFGRLPPPTGRVQFTYVSACYVIASVYSTYLHSPLGHAPVHPAPFVCDCV